jgi:MFS family permease
LGPRFAHLLAATGFSNLADGVLAVGVLLLAVTLTRSPALVSLVSTASGLPWLLLSLHAGVLIDRHDRVRILLLAGLARVLVLLTATVLAATGALTLPLLLVLVFAFGCAEVFADSTAAVLVPTVVPARRLAAANSRLMGLEQVANNFLGAPLAGLALAAGAGWLFGVPAALCALAGLLVVRGFRRNQQAGAAPVATSDGPGHGVAGAALDARPSLAAELRAALSYLRHHRVVGPLLLTGTVLNFSGSAYFAVFVLWLVGPGSRVGLPATAYGVLAAGLAVGAVAGAVVAEALQRRFSEARLITGAWLSMSLLLCVPVLIPRVWAIATALVLLGFANMVGNVVNASMRQRLVPRHLLGRVGGAARTISYGCTALGAPLGGVVGEVFGLPTVFLGVVVLSVGAVLWVIHRVPQTRIDEADAAALSDAGPT